MLVNRQILSFRELVHSIGFEIFAEAVALVCDCGPRILFEWRTINEFAKTERVLPEMKEICPARRSEAGRALAGWTNSPELFLCENS
jgi:hypothetical protein